MKILLLTIVLVAVSILALLVRLLFTKRGTFRGGSCQNHTNDLGNQGIGCGCSNIESCS